MASTGADFTNAFRGLMRVDPWAADDGDDAGLTYILSQLAPAGELAEANKPRVPMEHLLMLQQRANTDIRYAMQLKAIEAEMAQHERYATLLARTDAVKAKEDAEAWRGWLARYRARLRSEVVPATADDSGASAKSAWAAARRDTMGKVRERLR